MSDSSSSSSPPEWTRTFLYKRTVAALCAALFLVSGFLAYQSLIKEALPNLAIPIADVQVHWHGASPGVMEKEVTNKIEKELRGMKGLKRYSSGSQNSHASFIVEFEPDAPLRESMDLLREKVRKAEADFHKSVEKPKITQFAIRNSPILSLVLYGDLEERELGAAAKRLKRRIERINGIRKATLYGHRKEFVFVQLIPEQLQAQGISPATVIERLRRHEQDLPLGEYENRDLSYLVKSETAFHDVATIRDLPLGRSPDGKVVRVKDIARVEQTLYRKQWDASFSKNGSAYRDGVAISAVQVPGRDTVGLTERIKQVVEEARSLPGWPQGMQYEVVFNEGDIIGTELKTSLTSGWQAVLVVFAVLFILLTWREALVAALCIPITLLGTLGVLWLMGYTLNVMVIIGVILALGLLVDDFILMMEGMHDGVFVKRLPFFRAAWRTVKSYALPSLSGTITTVLVLVPLAAIGGLDGKFIRLIPVTAAICLMMSYLVSILVAIPLSRIVLDGRDTAHKTPWIDRVSAWAEGKLTSWLRSGPVASRSRSVNALALGAVVFLFAAFVATQLPVILNPQADGRDIGITVELPVDYKLDESEAVARDIGAVLREKPYIESVLRIVGERDFLYEGSPEDSLSVSTAPNNIGFNILLTPKDARDRLGYQYVRELRRSLNTVLRSVPGHRVTITAEDGGPSNQDPVQINLSGPNMGTLRDISLQVQHRLYEIDGLNDVRDNLSQSKAEAVLRPRREMLDYYDIDERDLNLQLSMYLGDTKIAHMRRPGTVDDMEIRIASYWPSQSGRVGGPADREELWRIPIRTPDGRWVPYRMLVDQEISEQPSVITHKNGQRSLTVMAKTFTLPLDEVHRLVDPVMQDLQKSWPPGYTYRYAGEQEAAREAYGNSAKALIIAVVLVFGVLALQFDSFKQPVIILFAALFAIMGVVLGFGLLAYPFSFAAMIGVIALVGITVNDSIVMVDTMNRHRKAGLSVREAAARGSADRLRPIVSTTLTTILGLLPLAIADEQWRPLCMAIVCGETVSTVTSLALIPCLYNLLTKDKEPARDPAAVADMHT